MSAGSNMKAVVVLGIVVLAGAAYWHWSKQQALVDLPPATAEVQLDRFVKEIGPKERIVDYRAKLDLQSQTTIEDTLPEIDRFALTVDPVLSGNDRAVELFVSTEKSGTGDDGWMVGLAETFNRQNIKLSNGEMARIQIRSIPSGTAYQYIVSGKHQPDGYSPSNRLWIEMAEARGVPVTPIRESLVTDLAGVVLKKALADELSSGQGGLDMTTLVDAVVQGTIAMGYTDPFASSTGLNFLISVLQTFADGDNSRLLSPDVASAFENFQRGVPFVALTTLHMREAVHSNGSLDAFVMEYKTFMSDETLQSGYEFIPFGELHDNPLYAVGAPSPEVNEALEKLAELAEAQGFVDSAREMGFSPPVDYTPAFETPDGRQIIEAQKLWKEKKDAGRPIAAVFVCDVSGSMEGSRIRGVQEALKRGAEFISPQNAVGLVAFADDVSVLLPIKPFNLTQKASFVGAAERLPVGGGTAMYDGIAVAMDMLLKERQARPEVKPMLFVLTDGETNEGLRFDNMRPIVEALDIPVYTVGYEADIAELARLSGLVEATSLNAGEDDVSYRIGMLLNAEL